MAYMKGGIDRDAFIEGWIDRKAYINGWIAPRSSPYLGMHHHRFLYSSLSR